QPDVRKINHQQWWTAPSAALIRAAVLREIKFDTSLTNCEDTDMWRRISWRHRIHHMNAILFKQRRAHPSLTRNRFRALCSEVRLFRKTWRDTPPEIKWALPTMNVMRKRITQSLVRIYLDDIWTGTPLLLSALRYRLHWRKFKQILR